MNLGMEITPYWLSSRPFLTHEKYNEPNIGQTILQTLGISAATVKDSVTHREKFGIGIRFSLLNGKPNPEYAFKQQELVKLLTVQALANAGRVLAGSQINTIEDAKVFFVEPLFEPDMKLTMGERMGLTAMANKLAEKFPDSPAGVRMFFDALVEEMGIQNKSTIYKHISARYQFLNLDTSLNNFDVGFAYTKELKKFSLSAEGMLRWYAASIPDFNSNNQPIMRLEKDFTYRIGLQTSYNITDGIGINMSIGKDFNSPYFNRQGFFSIFGLNYSLFDKEKVAVVEKE